jgi:microcystin degradation protein MlrC
MTRVLIAGYQHETNTFAPSLADWAAFTRGDSFPAFVRGQEMVDQLRGVNIPVAGVIDAARTHGWQLVPSCWAGAIPSSYVTRDAFERIAQAICDDIRAAQHSSAGLDAVVLDLHGAAVAEHADDSEGELLARVRALIGPRLPLVASLDLHANVTQRMLSEADALVSYRTYPHVDMADTGVLAAELLARRLKLGHKEPQHARRFPFLIPINAQSTWQEPAKSLYDELIALDRAHGTVSSFCMGFPASDFDECGPVIWSHGERAARVADALFSRAAEPTQWRESLLAPRDAAAQAIQLAENAARPVVIADTQDNPGAGGDSNTTGMLHALVAQGAGRRYPGQVALGYKVVKLSDGVCTLQGPMMTGLTVRLGPSACLEIDGVRVAVVSGKKQLLDRALLRMVGIAPEQMRIVVVKSSNHFRADFQPHASHVLVAKAPGPMAADPADLPWKKLPAAMRRHP